MATFLFPRAIELTEVAQEKTPRLEAERAGFRILPTQDVQSTLLAWEQMDNFLGLQQVRGIAGNPPRVKKVGAKRYVAEPGIYGEFIDLDEKELTERRRLADLTGRPMDITDLVMSAQDQLLGRRLDRIEQIIWTLLTTGTFSVAGPTGNILHTDTFTLQTYAAGVAWGTAATSTPMADFRAVQLLGRGKGVSFGRGATSYMNRTTYNQLVSNTNANDLGGRRLAGLVPANRLEDINQLLNGDDLSTIEVYDEGYLDDAGAFQLYIPNNKVVTVGQRPARQRIGEYRYTLNINTPGATGSGPYMRVIDKGENEIPRRVEVHDGHNGGPVLFFPSAIVVMTV